jgi:uncharacterized protein (DUF58 family)
MLSPEVQRKVRQLEIVTKGLMKGPLIGDDVSAHRGYGVEFHQIREYQFGDDVRFIDWKSSSRLNKMFVKECLEERNRNVILALDVSSSSFYGSAEVRFEKIKEVATILAFAAGHAKDSVGLLLFSDEIELVIESKNIDTHVHFLLQKLYEFQPLLKKQTDISSVLDYVAKKWNKDVVVFVISDFIDEGFEKSLRCAVGRSDLVAVRCYDSVERMLPSVGYLMVEDVETGESLYVEAEKKSFVSEILRKRVIKQDQLFSRLGVDVIDISYKSDSCFQLVDFFKRRMIHASLR